MDLERQIEIKNEYLGFILALAYDYDGYVTKESLKTTPDAQSYLMDRYRTFMNLDKEVEVIEEPKKIEKLETYKEKEGEDYFANILKLSPNSECEIDEALSTTIDKLNELIDEINNLKEKKDE